MSIDTVILDEDTMTQLAETLLEWGEEQGLTPHQFACLCYYLSLYVASQIDLDLKSTMMKLPIDQVN